jgi:hypothetical protein
MPWLPVLGAVAVPLAVGAAVLLSTRVHASPPVHSTALFVHLACLVLGFGAVLSVDWVATLWLLGRRPLADVLRTARNTHLPAWLGYAGLVASGALLAPDLTSWSTWVKLVLVVLVGWNGLMATRMQAPLTVIAEGPERRPLVQYGVVFTLLQAPLGRLGEPTQRRLLVQSAAMAVMSQVCWWGAMVIGFAHTR